MILFVSNNVITAIKTMYHGPKNTHVSKKSVKNIIFVDRKMLCYTKVTYNITRRKFAANMRMLYKSEPSFNIISYSVTAEP